MDLTLDEDERLLQTTAREVLSERRASAEAAAVADDPAGYSAALWGELVELGWPGACLPEPFGVDMGFVALCLLLEELGRARVPSPLLASVACCGIPIAAFGSERQKQRWLPAIASGRVFTYVRAAPSGDWDGEGSEVAAVDRRGRVELDGTACFVPFARGADAFVVVAERAETRQPIVAVVDADAPGVTCSRLGTLADPMFEVDFAGVAVEDDRVLEGGRAVVEAMTDFGTAATCAEMVGGAQGVLEETVGYATARHQFGQPIGAFQAVQHHCADMAVDVLTSRLSAYEAIWRLSHGLEARRELSVAKSWVGEAYQRVCAAGHQVHGAIGFTAEHHLHFYYRHAVSSSLAFGDADVHTGRLATDLGL